MAKGMNKGNREAKKPKKDKTPVKVVSASPTGNVREGQERQPPQKK
ncbi:MAG: hypothetical protein ACK4GO_06530 [Gemmobacter sp.]